MIGFMLSLLKRCSILLSCLLPSLRSFGGNKIEPRPNQCNEHGRKRLEHLDSLR
jgi:hypothetical protein